MWRQIQNLCYGLGTYHVLRPDTVLRSRVNLKLQHRLALDPDEWFEAFWHQTSISPALSAFAYYHIPQYSGIQSARLKPGDRLEADLCWTQICWFDWEMDLYDDFLQCFDTDISEDFDFGTIKTVADFMDSLAWYVDDSYGNAMS